MKRFISLMVALLATASVFAQDSAPVEKSFWSDPFSDPMFPLYVVMTLVFVVAILVTLVAFYLIRILNLITRQQAQEKAQQLGVKYQATPTLWQRFIQMMNASVPVEQEKNIELDHNYDGIKELDNYLPPWWKWLFYGTIVWAVGYIFIFHLSSSLPLSEEEYNNEVAAAQAKSERLKASQPQSIIDANTLVYTPDAAILEKGKAVFISTTCNSCHRNDGGGNTIGPNLTDEYWIHGGGVKNIFNTITNGAVEKGMPAWGKALSPTDIRDVTFYVMSLQGSKPDNAKAPQGELYKETNTVPTDTIKTEASL